MAPSLLASLFAIVATAAVGFTAEPPAIARRLPPPGVATEHLAEKLEPASHAAWEAVPGRIADLRQRLEVALIPDDATRADIEVLIKAVEFALDGGEWWRPAHLEHAVWASDEAAARLDAIDRGERPWRTARGLSVHGFRSALDGSVQPYGLWIPDALDLSKPVPLWIWLHGRGEQETDLHFLHQRAHNEPEFMPDDAIVLLPFGRYCNGWKGPGLVDVFEARDGARGIHRIDPDRIVIAGFSMGGAGAWQIGARRAGEFCAVHGGAGFVDTRRYTGVDVTTIPWYETRLWTTTDVPPVARNLLNLPAIAYSGETDKQRAASEIMVETLAAEGRDLPHVVGADMPHKYDNASKQTIAAFLQQAATAGRPTHSAEIHLATTTLADARVGWVEALGLGEHFCPARVDAGRAEEGGKAVITATTANMTAVAFHVDPAPHMIHIDGVVLDVEDRPAGDPLVVARKELHPDGAWRIAMADDLPPMRKRPGLTGPIDDAFTKPFIVVPPVGPGFDPAVDRFVNGEFEHFRRRWRDLFRGELPVVAAADVTDAMLRDKNLVLFGDPLSNPLIAKVLPGLPIHWTSEGLAVAGQIHAATSHVPVLIHPNSLVPPTAASAGRYVVLNSGFTFREDADISNSWQNPKLPDYAVVDISVPPNGRSPGRIAAAGFYDEAWRIATADGHASHTIRDTWATHCGNCHFDGAAEGNLALDAMLDRLAERPSAAGGPDHAAWMSVLRHLRAEMMPPAEEPQPTAEVRRQLIAFVERDVFRLDPARPDPGHVVLRRLNRSEYAHTIRDLTGLDVDVSDELPSDDTGYGFDTIGDVLSMSPLLVEKYLALASSVAEAVVNEAVPERGPSGDAHRYPSAVRRVFALGPPPTDAEAQPAHLRDTIARLAERAFRGRSDDAITDRLVTVARTAMQQPDGSYERGVAAALTAMLSSPRFLFHIEADGRADPPAGQEPSAVPLDDIALASRLSSFLWSSMPDDELLTLAREGRLSTDLDRQIDRMIADPRSNRFVGDFVGQWLRTRDVESLPFDVRRVLGGRDRSLGQRIFSDRVRRAMRDETEMLFAHLLRDNQPATELVVGRQTFLNEPLARFYGVPDIEGPEMRLVTLADDSHRGGLLTHGSLLVVTSNPTRTSPVKRGQFILDNLLGTPAPPPPPDVPALEAVAEKTGRKPTMRELMEVHRQDALCASCHARMDPLGLALEQYNALGQWQGANAEGIDTSGRLITGETFADAGELAALIAGPRRRDFHRCLAEKLLVYALGRGLEYFDGPAVDTIMERLDREGGGLATLVHAVCESVPFRMRRAIAPAAEDQP